MSKRFLRQLEEAFGRQLMRPKKITAATKSPEIQTSNIIDKIRARILNGKSMIKKPLKAGIITMDQIVKATQNKRCIPLQNRDLGSTYMANTIGSAIRDEFEGEAINAARRVFGMKPINLEKERQKKIRKQMRRAGR